MTHENFIKKYINRYIDWDKYYGAQCVDLMRFYLNEVWNVPQSVIPSANWAKTQFINFRDDQFARKILNSPNNAPKKGDIIFWSTYWGVTGIAGHVAIVHEAGLYSFISFDQNYPTNNPCRFVKHDYRGVMGWIRLK